KLLVDEWRFRQRSRYVPPVASGIVREKRLASAGAILMEAAGISIECPVVLVHDVGQLPHDIAEVGFRFFGDRLAGEVVNRVGRSHIEAAGKSLSAETADSCSDIEDAS